MKKIEAHSAAPWQTKKIMGGHGHEPMLFLIYTPQGKLVGMVPAHSKNEHAKKDAFIIAAAPEMRALLIKVHEEIIRPKATQEGRQNLAKEIELVLAKSIPR